ncbi:MAG: YwaF family protein [Clostridia bacterium]|nr:YwaF family protein [Clostridia bacterium]
MKEFLGIGGYTREPEGYLSWQHILFVGLLLCTMFALSILLGLRNRKRDDRSKNTVLIASAILIDVIEIAKIAIMCYRSDDPTTWQNHLPLFLCSIQLITIPLAAFTKGRTREASLDFVFIFGLLGAILGTVGAGQNYNAYPVLSLDNVASGITHCISGFAALYIGLAGMASMQKRNIWITFTILGGFCVPAYLANIAFGTNYMFLMQGDGTPYDILYNLLGGSPILYPLGVLVLFLIYIAAFYSVFFLIRRRKSAYSPAPSCENLPESEMICK